MRIEIQPGVRLFVDIDGCGLVPDGATMRAKPALVLLHGGPGFDHSSFKPLFGRLSDVAQVVYVDQRGHGRSDRRPSSEWNLDTFADDVVRLCDALGITQPVVLGQSWGGFVAQRYLARHPAHPGRVILSSTSHHFGLARKLAMFDRLGGSAARQAAEDFWRDPTAAAWAAYERTCRPLYNTRPPADPDAKARTIAEDAILFHSARHEMPTMDLRAGLARVRCPVLVMHGDADPVTPIEDALEIVAALPPQWAHFERFENVGHGPWRDAPERALAVIRRFVGGG
ncbi:MAG: alpha/beta hydrolase [Rubrivivax sp.]